MNIEQMPPQSPVEQPPVDLVRQMENQSYAAHIEQHNAFADKFNGQMQRIKTELGAGQPQTAQRITFAHEATTDWGSQPPTNLPDLSQVREGKITHHVANGVERLLGTQMQEEDRRLLVYGLQKVGGAALFGAGFRDAQGNKIPGSGRRAARHPFQALSNARHASANAADQVVDDIDRIEAARRQREDYELAA